MKTLKICTLICASMLSLSFSAATSDEATQEIREKIHIDQQMIKEEKRSRSFSPRTKRGAVNFALQELLTLY